MSAVSTKTALHENDQGRLFDLCLRSDSRATMGEKMKDEPRVIQVYASLSREERRRLKVAQAMAEKPQHEWNREALLEKLEREERK